MTKNPTPNSGGGKSGWQNVQDFQAPKPPTCPNLWWPASWFAGTALGTFLFWVGMFRRGYITYDPLLILGLGVTLSFAGGLAVLAVSILRTRSLTTSFKIWPAVVYPVAGAIYFFAVYGAFMFEVLILNIHPPAQGLAAFTFLIVQSFAIGVPFGFALAPRRVK